MYLQVIVDVSSKQVNRPFTYLVPSDMEKLVEVGCRVIVPFQNRKILGIVVGINLEYEGTYNIKEIYELLDLVPVLDNEMLEIGYEMVKKNAGFLIDAFKTIIPSSLLLKYKKELKLLDKNALLAKYFLNKEIAYSNIPPIEYGKLKLDIQNKRIELVYKAIKKESILEERYLHLNIFHPGLPKKQQELVDYLAKHNDILKSDLPEEISLNVIKPLVEKEIITIYKRETYREIDNGDIEYKKVELNSEQEACYNKIKASFNKGETFLLHGVTGSGKTEIYLDLIEEVINEGKNALFMVPEISLTPQMVSRVKGRFKQGVAVFHSGLSQNERYDEWRRIFRDEIRIVVGARSSVFVPLKNLGIIIIDEEHDASYKQENGFRYHAKDIAEFRSRYHHAPLVLGSATPSVISYYRALNNENTLLEIKDRANRMGLPSLHIVNMSDELEKGNKTMFSGLLKDGITNVLAKKEQAILLVNKRGYSSFMMCRDCGKVIQCKNCDVSMTYHKATEKLMCHYCGLTISKVDSCPSCQSKRIKEVGIGTEQVCEYLLNLYPTIRVLRMDADTTTKKGSHANILGAFKRGEADILVGTQMISKGLDFPNVTLVGILMADMILNLPDYRNAERTYQQIMQVSGRAGRHEKKGSVVVQGYNTKHYSITSTLNGNYKDFYKEEISNRLKAKYPPFYELMQLVIEHKDMKLGFERAKQIVKKIKELNSFAVVLGPAIASIARVKNKYRIQIMVKSKEKIDLNSILEENQDINLFIDSDPILI